MSAAYDVNRPDLGGNVRHGDQNTWAPNLWRYLRERFAISSMLDVGCGEGHAVDFFSRMGVKAFGIDGLLGNVQRAVTPIALHDLLSGPFTMPVDFVWSCEVAEHIAPEKVDYYVDTLANARIIAMTHAVPGQPGHHHVNCQPSEYWVAKIASRGYSLYSNNEVLRRIAAQGDVPTYFQYTGLLFLKD